jgi:hypothetical protein
MKFTKLFFVFLFACLGISTSCDKGTMTSKGKYFYGTWDVSLVGGQGDLTDILTVKIDESTVTMTFKEGGAYGALYDYYGSSNTVSYSYNENDVDPLGKKCASLTFDSHLYFAEWSYGNAYVSKVFIGQGQGFLTGCVAWRDDSLSHQFILSK